MSTSYSATTFVEADPDRVFEYVLVPENQPSWAINFVRSTRPLSDGRYAMQTPAGELIYRIEEDPRCRTVDFVYETPEGETTMILPTRVVPHGRGSVFIFTIHRQPGMGDAEWEGGQRGLEVELTELKKLLEA
jgi:hypothetical protein